MCFAELFEGLDDLVDFRPRPPTRLARSQSRHVGAAAALRTRPRVEAVSESSDRANCPVCREPFEVDGPAGVLVHLLARHPQTDEAWWVVCQVSLLSDRDWDLSNVQASEGV